MEVEEGGVKRARACRKGQRGKEKKSRKLARRPRLAEESRKALPCFIMTWRNLTTTLEMGRRST